MREMKKEDAVRQYGHHYKTPLARLELHPKRGTTPATELLLKLEKLSTPFEATLSVVEGLGKPVQPFHFKDLADATAQLGAERREELKAQLQEFVMLYATESNTTSDQPEIASKLKQAWDDATLNMQAVKEFLDSGRAFTMLAQFLPEVMQMPDEVKQAGDKVYLVSASDTIVPTLAEVTVKNVTFMPSFFRNKGEITAQYEIDTGRKPTQTLISRDAKGEANAAFASSSHSAAYGTEAAAKAHIGAAMNAQEKKLKAELGQLRKARKSLGL